MYCERSARKFSLFNGTIRMVPPMSSSFPSLSTIRLATCWCGTMMRDFGALEYTYSGTPLFVVCEMPMR